MCVKIESPGGDAPKMFGRHFDETDMLMSRVCWELLISFFSFNNILIFRSVERVLMRVKITSGMS